MAGAGIPPASPRAQQQKTELRKSSISNMASQSNWIHTSEAILSRCPQQPVNLKILENRENTHYTNLGSIGQVKEDQVFWDSS